MIPLNKLHPAAGKLLVAEPFMKDDYFRRAVVLLAEHNEEGSFGFILNKPLKMKMDEVLEGFPSYKETIFLGGPVNKNQLFYVHTLGSVIPESIQITEGLFWGGDFETVKQMIANNQLLPDQLRFFAGYAGWEAKQLDNEMDEKAWIVSDMRLDIIFKDSPIQLWADVLKGMGKEFSIMSNFPEDPSQN